MNITTKDFYESHYACPENRLLALRYETMAEVWDACPRADWLIWMLERTSHKLNPKMLRLFACWCVRETPLSDGRKVWDLLTDERSRNAVIVAERFAKGEATEAERFAAAEGAWDAAEDFAVGSAASSAAESASDAAWSAVESAAESASDAAGDAGESERRAHAFQADHFRTLFKNPFQN